MSGVFIFSDFLLDTLQSLIDVLNRDSDNFSVTQTIVFAEVHLWQLLDVLDQGRRRIVSDVREFSETSNIKFRLPSCLLTCFNHFYWKL